ncbi:MAG: NfeD family protein [Elusimicrobia bacterium]|nr:NfeD family protein [Elusimicrobiota bacterium]
MAWWMWLIVGLGLLAGELVTPGGFFVIFFAVSALIVMVLSLLGVGGPVWVQGLTFVALAVVLLLLFRRRLLARFRPSDDLGKSLADVVGGVAMPVDDIPAGSVGKAEYRGSSWSVRNVGDKPVAKGQRCRVQKVEGLMLFVTAE